MDTENKKYLPLGTVVLLQGASKRLMITGFVGKTPEIKDQIFDYSGCVYPEGFSSYKEVFVFNHSQIAKVISLGYIDDEQIAFEKKLEEKVSQLSNK